LISVPDINGVLDVSSFVLIWISTVYDGEIPDCVREVFVEQTGHGLWGDGL
jgi:hypothetical protein